MKNQLKVGSMGFFTRGEEEDEACVSHAPNTRTRVLYAPYTKIFLLLFLRLDHGSLLAHSVFLTNRPLACASNE